MHRHDVAAWPLMRAGLVLCNVNLAARILQRRRGENPRRRPCAGFMRGMRNAVLLHLAHSRTATDAAAGAGVGAAAGSETAHDGGCEEGGECEPEERSGGLGLTAASARTLSHNVAVEVVL